MKRVKNVLSNIIVKNYLIIFLTLFVCEMIFKLVGSMSLFTWATLRIAIGLSILALFVALFNSFIKKRFIHRIINLVLAVVFCIYALIQAGFQNYLGVYMSVHTSSQLGAVKDYLGNYIASFDLKHFFILLPLILLVIYYLFFDRSKTVELKAKKAKKSKMVKKENKYITKLVIGLVIIVLCFLYYGTLKLSFMQNVIQLETNIKVFKNPSMPNIAVNQFGVMTYGVLDIKTLIIMPEKDVTENFSKIEQEQTDYSREIDDTAWNMLAASETNETYKQLNNYFMTRNITDKNEYTGIFADKNLIVIMMESVNNIILNEEYYPNIYKLYSEGWSWENAYSPRNTCATGNNEMSSVLGLFSINNNCTANRYYGNTYYESLYNLFNNADYTTSAFHNYNDSYYYRNKFHKNWGSTYYDIYDLGIKITGEYKEWPSDEDLITKSSEFYMNNDSFMTYLLTVTSHMPYSVSSVYGDKNLELFNNLSAPMTIKRYMSKLKELDNAIGTLTKTLEEKDILDDTVIVLLSDHYPYGLKSSDLQTVMSEDLSVNQDIDRTPFIIYNSEIEPQTFSEYTSFINLTPTLANLFGLDYDPRLYAGEDIFSDSYSDMVIFSDGSWENENLFYNSTNGTITMKNDEVYGLEEDIAEINNVVRNKIKMSNLAIEHNYFNYLEEGLKKYNMNDANLANNE